MIVADVADPMQYYSYFPCYLFVAAAAVWLTILDLVVNAFVLFLV